MTATPLPAALAALLHRRSVGLEQWTACGRFDLRIDDLTRVSVRQGRRDGLVVVETRLAALPPSARDREELLARVMLRVTAGAERQIGVVALSAEGEQLILQAELNGGDAGSFDAAFEAYLNEIDYWKALLGRRQHS